MLSPGYISCNTVAFVQDFDNEVAVLPLFPGQVPPRHGI